MADVFGGWTCQVEQGHYGHRARKATWLYAVGVALPSLLWGPSRSSAKIDLGFHSKEERAAHRRAMKPPAGMTQEQRDERREYLARIKPGWCAPERMNKRERTATPLPFRDLLLGVARSACVSPITNREQITTCAVAGELL